MINFVDYSEGNCAKLFFFFCCPSEKLSSLDSGTESTEIPTDKVAGQSCLKHYTWL